MKKRMKEKTLKIGKNNNRYGGGGEKLFEERKKNRKLWVDEKQKVRKWGKRKKITPSRPPEVNTKRKNILREKKNIKEKSKIIMTTSSQLWYTSRNPQPLKYYVQDN